MPILEASSFQIELHPTCMEQPCKSNYFCIQKEVRWLCVKISQASLIIGEKQALPKQFLYLLPTLAFAVKWLPLSFSSMTKRNLHKIPDLDIHESGFLNSHTGILPAENSGCAHPSSGSAQPRAVLQLHLPTSARLKTLNILPSLNAVYRLFEASSSFENCMNVSIENFGMAIICYIKHLGQYVHLHFLHDEMLSVWVVQCLYCLGVVQNEQFRTLYKNFKFGCTIEHFSLFLPPYLLICEVQINIHFSWVAGTTQNSLPRFQRIQMNSAILSGAHRWKRLLDISKVFHKYKR